MKHIAISILLLLLLVVSPLRAALPTQHDGDSWTNTQYNTTEGTEFWVTFMRNSGSSGQDNKDMSLYLYATSREDAMVTLVNPRINAAPVKFQVKAGEQNSCLVPNQWAYIEHDKQIGNYGVKVTSDKPISLYATNQHSSGKYDATNILPAGALMGEYVVQTYRIDQYSTEFAIVATQTQTVTIHLKKTTIDIEEYEKNGKVVVISETEETIPLSMTSGQTYLYRSASDDGGSSANRATSLSGTTICSNAPIALFMGGQSAKIPSDPENHIFSQAYPTDKWGKTFYVTPTYGMVYDYVQFTACKNNTQIRRNGNVIATINARESYIDTIKSEVFYNSMEDLMASKIIYVPNVVQYTTSELAECFLYATSNTANHPSMNGNEIPSITTNFGAPTLTPIIPQELAMRSTMFATFTKTNTKLYHYVNIVTPTAEVSGMRLDGKNIAAEFKPIQGTNYSYAIKEITNTAHLIENVRGEQNSTFTARVYGLGQSSSSKESYAYAVGSRVNRKTDMLVNNQYIKEKTICITQDLKFTGLVEGDYISVEWDFKDDEGITTGSEFEKTHKFGNAGDYFVEFIVKRPYPYICSSGYPAYDYVYDNVGVLIHVKDRYNANFHRKICEGDSVVLTGRDENGVMQEFVYKSNHTETKHFYTIDGCDSIVSVKIEVGQPEQKETAHTTCEYYVWHGNKYTESGRYEWETTNAYGCVVTEILNLTILQPVAGESVKKTICANSTIEWNGQQISTAGTYTAKLIAANGCDSIATLIVTVEDEYREEQTIWLCYGETYQWRGRNLTAPNTYTDKSPSPLGCDSTFVLHLLFYPDYNNIQIQAETCEDSPYLFGDDYLTQTGTYTKKFTSIAGCDSVVTLSLTVWPLEYDTIRANICQGEIYTFYGRKLTTSGEYQHVETNLHGCAKTTTLYLTVSPQTHKYDTIRICEQALPYMYANKYVATQEGDYTQVLDVRNQYDCDSIYHLHLIVDETIITPLYVNWCDYMGPYSHPNPNASNLQNLTETNVYRQVLQTTMGCDSIIELHLSVGERTYNTLPVNVCDNELPWRDPNQPSLYLYRDTTYNDTIENASGCDSIITIVFDVHKTYNETINVVICDNEIPYNHPDSRFYSFQGLTISDSYTQTVKTISGCDSTVTLNLTINPTTYNYLYETVCEDALPYGYGDSGKQAYATGEYRDTLNVPNQYGCDSVVIVYLDVLKTIVDFQTVVLCDNEIPYNHPDPRAIALQKLSKSGVYRDTLKSQTGCDSIIELTLQILPTYDVEERQMICDYEEFDFHGHIFKNLSAQSNPYRFDTTLMTVDGCDSVVHLYLTVNPSYIIPTVTKTICQDTENQDWEWRGDDGILHGIVSIAEPREVFLADTLKTQHGCDSIIGLQLRIIPSYRFDSVYTICQNEHVSWQGKSYCGNQAVAQSNDIILPPGIYHDTISRQTTEGCDSVFYLQLHVNPVYDVNVNMAICDNEDKHVLNLSDTQGTIIQDTLPFTSTPSIEGVKKDIIQIDRDYDLKTIYGCDSIVHLHATIYPTYEFVTQVKICGTEDYEWRGKKYYETGVYYDSLKTIDGCDSVYVLDLYKKPMLLIPMYDTICDTETFEHVDTLWYTNGSHVLVETMVWIPGMPIPQTYSDVVFRSKEDGCDSVVYRYWLTINKSYSFVDTAVICSNESYTTSEHFYTGYEFELLPNEYRPIFDTVLYDNYTTINGCDSIYALYATIYPAYRHRDTITICDDESTTWRKHYYEGNMIGNKPGDGLVAGHHVFRDSFKTVYGCDSIYELHLYVTPTHLFEEHITKCADENLTWRKFNLDQVSVGTHFYYDSLQTIGYGCDSVYHLYLTVNDTTSEVIYDTICRTESYNLHGVHIYEPGYYYDTTLNEWGCHHFTHLYLEVIEPTVPIAWADSICADDDAYDLYYTYTGRDPIAYSVLYDDEGHYYGFEDIVDEPIETEEQLSILTIPMPLRDGDKTKYPKPNYYNIKLVLDNGICTNPDLCSTDTSIVLSYPSWITQQRFGDVIALYNEKYNGGYYWSHYQWYHGDTLLVGETHEYLYVPTGLVVGDQYHVRLTREGEMQDFQTCPITIVADPIVEDFAPTMGYLSVVPTCVCADNPIAYILSRKDGTYIVTTCNGTLLKKGVFRADVTEVPLPNVEGLYVFQLDSPDTPEEPCRRIKVLVSKKCPNYDIPF